MRGRAGGGGSGGRLLFVPTVIVGCLLAVGSAAAARAGAGTVGYDLSYPQCNGPFPNGGAFGIVGVNKGLPFSPNPCLGAGGGPSELAWAGMDAQFYANTADPGPTLSSHWPNGQTVPEQCNTAAAPGADTASCAYDYGWNAAQDSYQDAVSAYVSLGWASPGATRTPVANGWWLDVETANSWEADSTNNLAELQGEVDYLKWVGTASVGFYSPPTSWQTITSGAGAFASYPAWVPGAASLADAQARCSTAGASGGPTGLVQFLLGGVVADTTCAPLPTLSFQTAPAVIAVGTPSPPITVQLSQGPGTSVTVSLTSSSMSGRFATAATGPWTPALSVSVAASATQIPPVYYQDTVIGTAVLTATAAGYANATQAETIEAAPPPSPAPPCKLPPDTDHNKFELALAHTRTRAAAGRLIRLIARQTRARHLRAIIEQDGCTDFEVAVLGFHSRAAAAAARAQARPRFRQAMLERT